MISIVTPVYNGRRYIEACIQSVISQNCPEVEHIIIDGGSTDGTVDIIRQNAEQYPHIRWISEKDRGQSDAMNKGITMARGEIIGILNVDDYYEPNVLNRVFLLFKSLPVPALLVGNCNVWNDQGSLILVNKPKKLRLADLLLGPNINPFPLNPSAYFYHTELHQQVGYYKVDDPYTMDIDFIFKAVQRANIHYVDETWGNFRLISGTKTLEDMRRGTATSRQVLLLKSYRKELPLLQHLHVVFMYTCYNSILLSLLYFWKNPKELPWRLKNRLVKLFRSSNA